MTGRRLPLADEMWLVCHSDRSGRSRLHPRPEGMVVAAALIGELMLSGHAGLMYGAVHVGSDLTRIGQHPPAWEPGDTVAATVWTRLLDEPEPRDVGLLLDYLGRDAADLVAGRLVRAGVLYRRGSRLPGLARYVPVDPDTAFGPVVRLHGALPHAETLPVQAALLGGLVDAAGLTSTVLDTAPPGRLTAAVQALPAPLLDLVVRTRAEVAAVTLTR